MRWLAIILLVTVLGGTAISNWVLTTTSGLQWLLSATSKISSGKVQFVGVNGTFKAVRIQSINVTNDDQQFTISDFKFDWQPDALFSNGLIVKQLSAHEVEIFSPPSSDPLSLPEGLDLPLSLSIQRIDIASLRVFSKKTGAADFAATNLSATFESDGQQHHLSHLNFISEYGSFNAAAQLEGNKPFNLTAHAKLIGLTEIAQTTLSATSISATISGNLSQLNLNIERRAMYSMAMVSYCYNPLHRFLLRH